MTALTAAAGTDLSANEAWSRRVRRVGGLIQLAFATFWLVRGSLIIGGGTGLALTVISVTVAGAAAVYGLWATAGTAPRPTGPEAKRIERDVTIATVIQLLASLLVPVLVIAAGHPNWVLPSIAITIGPLLLWLDRRLDVPRYRPVGAMLIVGPVLLIVLLSGVTLAAATGIGAGALLLATATAGFHDLAGLRPRVPARPIQRTSPRPRRDSNRGDNR